MKHTGPEELAPKRKGTRTLVYIDHIHIPQDFTDTETGSQREPAGARKGESD